MVAEEDLPDVVLRMIRHGARHVLGPPAILDDSQVRRAHRSIPERYLFTTPIQGMDPFALARLHPRVPTVLVFPAGATIAAEYLAHDPHLPSRILLVPLDATDPIHAHRSVADTHPTHLTIDDLLRIL
jgi:hypothetical protein